MSSLSIYSIVFVSVFLALYLPLQRKTLAEAFPQSAGWITTSALAGSACFLVFATWLALRVSGPDTLAETLKTASWSVWLGGLSVGLGLCCVLVATYFQIRNISHQRAQHRERMIKTQAELQKLDDQLAALGIQLPQDQAQPRDGKNNPAGNSAQRD